MSTHSHTRLAAIALALSLGASRALADHDCAKLIRLKGLDLSGKVHQLEDFRSSTVALIFLSGECPLCNQYITELNLIHVEYKDRGVTLLGIISDPHTTRAQAARYASEFRIAFPLLFDANGEWSAALEPTHVPEVFVLSKDQLVYRGRIDDLYTENLKRRNAATRHDLREVLTSLVEGNAVDFRRTQPVGCKLQPPSTGQSKGVNFNRHIASILHANCAECHRAGEVAPFPLLTYQDAAKRAQFIAEVVEEKRMPPWKARPEAGHFAGERRLTDGQIALIKTWAEGGAPEGDPADVPPSPQFVEGWKLGTPDVVVKMKEPYKVPAAGPDLNRFFVIPIDIPEDMVVVGAEFRPGNPRITHHAIMYLDRSGNARKRDEATPEQGFEGFIATDLRGGGILGFWAPGYTPRFYPADTGQILHAKTDMALQIHYHPSGKDEEDQSQVGIYFAKKPTTRRMNGIALINFNVDIPAGEPKHKISHTFTTPVDLEIVDVTPHMHLVGTEMKVTATLPDGTVKPLIWVDWDFNWQDIYLYQEPTKLPKGTRFDLEAYFDNSASNPANPSSPPKHMGFGEQTTDEMCICAFRSIGDSEEDRKLLAAAVRDDMQRQLKDPKVFMSVMRFMMTGGGRVPDRLKGNLEDAATGKPAEW